ncbi:hypothetical protein CNR22_07170 [Sphingobacteriaceae bacterium]|nr:hypothetical protein CNR22_07170 [Sphingobacteriaceae bacterium]
MKKPFLLLFFSLFLLPAFSQQDSLTLAQDSVAKAKAAHKQTYSGPRRASTLSAILPGLGQVYNKKYWKVPIIYVGLGGFGYMFVTNNREYNYYRQNLRAEADLDPLTINETRYNTSQLQVQKVTYRKKRDIAILGIAILYILNIVDANVDAHLKTFDVSDDLSLQIDPWPSIYKSPTGYRTGAGLSLTLKFK